MRRVLLPLLALACLAVVVAFQLSRPVQSSGDPRVFVPSPRLYEKLSPSFRTSIADVYWLGAVQYYGEHVDGDGRLDSLPAMLDLVTALSPRFIEPYLFGTFALSDAGEPQKAYDLLKRGYSANPSNWRLPYQLGFLAYTYGEGSKAKALAAAKWFTVASGIEGHPLWMPRLAAGMLRRGGERERAILLWGPIFTDGDEIARTKAVSSLAVLLPKEEEARIKALVPLYRTMPRKAFDELVARLLAYEATN